MNYLVCSSGFFKGVLGTQFWSLDFQIGSLESQKIIIRSLKSENQVPRIREIGSLQIHIWYLTFSFKKNLV